MDWKGKRGFSLIEMLIAIAALGTVMLTIITLFFMGRRNVYAGKQMTRANAAATRVLEDLSYLSAMDLMSTFNLTDSTTLSAPCLTVGSRTFSDCVVVTANPSTTASTNSYIASWSNMVLPAEMQGGSVKVVFTPTDYTNASHKFTTANFLRVNAVVQWTEPPGRPRAVIFTASKAKRP